MHVFGDSLGCYWILGKRNRQVKPVGTTERYDQISRSECGSAASRVVAETVGMRKEKDVLDMMLLL